jgi:hypothetical protein
MNDDHAVTAVRDHLAGVRDSFAHTRPCIPASEIIARAGRRRTHRVLSAAGAVAALVGLVVTLAFAAAGHARHPVHVHLAAWSVNTNPDGTVDFTLRKVSQPARLQHVLTEARIPAMVRWGQVCLPREWRALVSTEGFVKTSAMPRLSQPQKLFAMFGGRWPPTELNWSWTITPGKIPPATRLVISAVPGRIPADGIQAAWEFVHSGAPLACARLVTPTTPKLMLPGGFRGMRGRIIWFGRQDTPR